jgi:hypothetical protein
LFGLLSGPIAMLAFIWLENRLHGTTFLGLELFGAPIIGSILGALEGTAVGAIWNLLVRRPRRLTIARLMLVVAISGPSLALFVIDPLVLINGLLLLPVWIVALGRRSRPEQAGKPSATGAPTDDGRLRPSTVCPIP